MSIQELLRERRKAHDRCEVEIMMFGKVTDVLTDNGRAIQIMESELAYLKAEQAVLEAVKEKYGANAFLRSTGITTGSGQTFPWEVA